MFLSIYENVMVGGILKSNTSKRAERSVLFIANLQETRYYRHKKHIMRKLHI